jgi:hypothetical protein
VKGLFCPELPGIQKSIAFYEGSHTSPVCPSDSSSINMKMIMDQWWNDTDMVKLTHLEKTLSQCKCIHLTWTGPGLNWGLCGERPVTNHLSHGTALKTDLHLNCI